MRHGAQQAGREPSLTDLLDANGQVQDSRAMRLLATHNLSLYATLMERHLSAGVVPEIELVVGLDRDLAEAGAVGDERSGLALIKLWAGQGWVHRVTEQRSGQSRTVCYLSQDARRALDFVRRMRRNDSTATGGSIAGLAARLKHVAIEVGDDPNRARAALEEEIARLQAQLQALDSGQRPAPDLVEAGDEAQAIAVQMERLITDIGLYGSMIEAATRALDEPVGTNIEYRERQRRLYADYAAAWESRGRDSHRAFLRMVNDPVQRNAVEADIAAVASGITELDPDLRTVMVDFFDLVGQQIDEVERIQQRCAQRVKRFTAVGTLEQSRGVARQLGQAIATAHALLKESLTDSRLDMEVPLARHAFSSIGAVSFAIRDTTPPAPAAEPVHAPLDLSAFAALTAQVDVDAVAHLVNTAVASGPVSLPSAISLLEEAYLGHVIVLWSWAVRQQQVVDDDAESVTVRFSSLDGRERAIAVPQLTFTEPVPTATLELM